MGRSQPEEAVTYIAKMPAWYRLEEGLLLGHALALTDREEEARRTLTMLRSKGRSEPGSSFHLALIHYGLGETDEAMTQLEKTYEEQSPQLVYLPWPLWDDVSAAPRFQALLRRMNFPETATPS